MNTQSRILKENEKLQRTMKKFCSNETLETELL